VGWIQQQLSEKLPVFLALVWNSALSGREIAKFKRQLKTQKSSNLSFPK
jgi:hypothetical protein